MAGQEQAVLRLWTEHPRYGKRRIQILLEREGNTLSASSKATTRYVYFQIRSFSVVAPPPRHDRPEYAVDATETHAII